MLLDTGLVTCVEKCMGARSQSRYNSFLSDVIIFFHTLSLIDCYCPGRILCRRNLSGTMVRGPRSSEHDEDLSFVEETLATLRANGCNNQGTINFLELLHELRPFFLRVRYLFGVFVLFLIPLAWQVMAARGPAVSSPSRLGVVSSHLCPRNLLTR